MMSVIGQLGFDVRGGFADGFSAVRLLAIADYTQSGAHDLYRGRVFVD